MMIDDIGAEWRSESTAVGPSEARVIKNYMRRWWPTLFNMLENAGKPEEPPPVEPPAEPTDEPA